MVRQQRLNFLWMLFLIGLAILAMAVVSDATTLAKLRFDDLAQQASAIGRMQCLRVESYWKNGEIWTRTEFTVLEEYKGTAPRIVTVEMPGGVVGHLHSRVEEVPAFVPGEEVYLFLWPAPDGVFHILGWSQGAFRIRRDKSTGLELVTQDSASAPIFDPVTKEFRHGGVRNLPVPVFQLKLKRALERQ
jgi:hypothetical protein